MKKRIIASLAILAVLGLAVAAYAYNQTSSIATAKVSCCKDKDSCPMKKKDASGKETASSCDCCKDNCAGDSCPMKKKGETAHMSKIGMSGNVTAATGDGCCCACCGDSCPMKKKDDEAKATAVSASEEGKNCCDNCDCCKGKAKTAAV